MAEKITISPITRINGFWRLDVQVEDDGKVSQAHSSGIYVRGLEKILEHRDPRDAMYLTQRICGICSSAHAMAGSLALEQAYNLQIPKNAVIIRNLIFGADLLQNHVRHFYFLSLPDFAKGPDEPPFIPRYDAEYRFSKKETDRLYQNYVDSIQISRLCHEMLTIYGGKAPHNHGIVVGGATVHPTADNIRLYLARLEEVTRFIHDKMIPDMELLAEKYADYYDYGHGPGRMLTFGMFPHEEKLGEFYFKSGYISDGQYHALEPKKIQEQVKYSWYEPTDATDDIMQGTTHFAPDKEGAYSWIKAPRYDNQVVETGPMARLWVSKDYRKGQATMDRLYARVLEAKKVALLMQEWLHKLEPGKPIYQEYEPPRQAEGIGLVEAMRGALGHWVRVENYKVATYQVVTPSAWNMSPRDEEERPGAVEVALADLKIADPKNPIEVGRVARSFDPCSSCAAQVYQPDGSIAEYIMN